MGPRMTVAPERGYNLTQPVRGGAPVAWPQGRIGGIHRLTERDR